MLRRVDPDGYIVPLRKLPQVRGSLSGHVRRPCVGPPTPQLNKIIAEGCGVGKGGLNALILVPAGKKTQLHDMLLSTFDDG